ncbi:MAG: 50S ribosomal protein L14e [Candidatus Aenigmatarchaeota archaeon]
MLEVGRVCMKISGREAGKYCVVLKKIDKSFVLVTGPKLLTGIKRRKCNVAHLEPLPYKLEIKEDASDEEVIQAFKNSEIANKLGLKFPSEGQIKAAKEKEKLKEAKEEKPKKKK